MTCVLAGGYSQASLAQQAKSSKLTQFVNPRIGTGGHGHVFLGANVPFGYVQLGPTEPSRGWDLSLIHISEPTRQLMSSRMPSSA